jgi:uncharacterized membrane protein
MSSKLQKIYAWILTAGGLAGLIAMTWQAAERIQMLKNPGGILSCNLNPVIDCGAVLDNRLAALFGFPNAFIGMAVFAMLTLSGVLLLTGNKPNRAFKHVILGLSTVLLLFSLWFFSVSLYIIAKICIFCLAGWVVAIPIFVYTLFYWLDNKDARGWRGSLRNFLVKNHLNVVITSYVIMAIMYFAKFSEYYF